MKKELPVPIWKQREVKVNYAIAKLMKRGIAFKSKEKVNFSDSPDSSVRCWIKYYKPNNEFHITLRFNGKDYITGAGEDNFDIDFYIPWEEFIEKFGDIVVIKEKDEVK